MVATAAGCVALPPDRTPTTTVALASPDASKPDGEGVGETVIIVVGDAFASHSEAAAAADEPLFGDVQGFYVDVSDNYRLLDICRGSEPRPPLLADSALLSGQWLLLTAFRTTAGAAEFVEQLQATQFAEAEVYLVEKLGGPDVGLGQEPHPDGGGPLLSPLDVEPTCG